MPDLGIDTCDTCREDRPVFWYYENGEAAVCGECLEQELLERDRLRADLATARRERDALALHLNLSRHEFAPEIPPRPGLADVECRHCEHPRWHPRHDTAAKILAALSAGGTDPTGDKR